jgi:glycosidase
MEERKWWKEAIGYQIYPKSFKDSNNDGIGDIKGIISKLDYLKELGVNLIWICPLYKSPMDDNGYDVSDFYDVSEDYGTLSDMQELIKQVHQRDMKIIFDLVLNHTSDEHPWFIESRKSKENPYRDYYIWKEGTSNEPPTNWASFFGGSCWQYDETTNEYYMKIFSKKMPDLNWANDKLRKSMHEVARWWLSKGVDGFRIDAIAHIAKDQSFSNGVVNEGDKLSYDWSKFSNLKEVHTYLNELNQEVFSKFDCVTIGECGGSATTLDALKYSGYDSKELNMSFTFDHCWENGAFNSEGKSDDEIKTNVVNLKLQFAKWQNLLYSKAWNPLYWLNHDHPRVISQYGDPVHYFKESAKMLCNTLYLMWGTPFIYNGEEIGMSNVDYTKIEQFKDIAVKDYVIDAHKRGISDDVILRNLRRTSRINARTPMQWNDSIYAGFSEHEPWVDVVGNYNTVNVESQLKDPDSILNYYKQIIKLRKDSEYKYTIIYGTFEIYDLNHPDVFAYIRKLDKKILVISNFTNKVAYQDVGYLNIKKVIISNYNTKYVVENNNIVLKPYESIIFELD